jgi:hypothetical protein
MAFPSIGLFMLPFRDVVRGCVVRGRILRADTVIHQSRKNIAGANMQPMRIHSTIGNQMFDASGTPLLWGNEAKKTVIPVNRHSP